MSKIKVEHNPEVVRLKELGEGKHKAWRPAPPQCFFFFSSRPEGS